MPACMQEPLQRCGPGDHVNVAFPGWLEVQKQLRAAYTPVFRQIVYTGFHRQVTYPMS